MKKAFTLSESLTVIFILGIIAVVTIPNLINKREKSNSRITLMKAVNTYKSVLTDEYYRATGVRTVNDFNDYLKSSNYSKITSKLSASGISCNSSSCTFQTGDNVRWNVSTPNKVMVGLKGITPSKTEAEKMANEKVFYISYSIDSNGRLVFLSNIDGCNLTEDTEINCIQKTRNFLLGE